MLRALAALLLLTTFAGCADGAGQPGDDDAAGAEEPDAGLAGTNATVAPPAPEPRPIVTNLTLDGQTATAVCVGAAGAGQCQVLQQPASSWTEFSTLGLPGTPTRLQATFTWTPVAPESPDLRVFVFSLAPEGPPVDGVHLTGDSPLTVDVDLAALEPGAGYAISIHSFTEVGAADAFVIGEASQPFHAELSITSMVPAA